MQKVSCPNCGAEVTFRSPALPSRVCDRCQTILVRSGGGLEMMGKAAVLPFDVSPIRIGTRGPFEGRAFEVVGRVRWGWTDGSWNEWLVLFGDGSDAWLAEAMGQFMITRERPLGDVQGAEAIREIILGRQVPIGTQAELDGETLIVSDAREATRLAAEGELPFSAPAGWTIYSVDFRTASGRVASLQREKTLSSFYDGRYVTLAELKPRDLRPIEGWPMPAFAA
jgi:ribosomal protein S27E